MEGGLTTGPMNDAIEVWVFRKTRLLQCGQGIRYTMVLEKTLSWESSAYLTVLASPDWGNLGSLLFTTTRVLIGNAKVPCGKDVSSVNPSSSLRNFTGQRQKRRVDCLSWAQVHDRLREVLE